MKQFFQLDLVQGRAVVIWGCHIILKHKEVEDHVINAVLALHCPSSTPCSNNLENLTLFFFTGYVLAT
jgi:hypothetical protein